MNRITALAAAAALTAGSLALVAPATAAPAKAYTVTAKANIEVAVAKEDTVKVRGRVTPKAAGEKVVLQQRVGNKKKWTVTGSSKIKRNGTYVLKDTPSTPGSREYRVLKPASGGFQKGFSDPVAVEVYRWEKLAYRTPVATNFAPATITVATEYYAASLKTGTPAVASSVEYTLGRKCTQLRATYALTDDSVSGATGAVTVSADGKALTGHTLAIGTVVADQVLDLGEAFRLRIDAYASASAYVGVGTPEVLCTR